MDELVTNLGWGVITIGGMILVCYAAFLFIRLLWVAHRKHWDEWDIKQFARKEIMRALADPADFAARYDYLIKQDKDK